MNKLLYIAIAILFISLNACEDWLEVSPKSEIQADVLFETENGFKDAITGIYVAMTDPKSYGKNLTWHHIETLAQQYDVANGKYEELQKYNYQEAVANGVVGDIWLKQYNIISEINRLLEALEKQSDIVNPILFDLIKGEALALRAFIHFDLLRLYGVGNLENRSEVLNQLTIPYVVAHSKNVTPQSTYKKVFELLHKDIENSLLLLKSDPYYTETITRPDEYEKYIEQPFIKGNMYKGRETKMNYGAVLAFQARVYMWEGNKVKALEAAEKSITAINYYIANDIIVWASDSWSTGYSYSVYTDRVFFYEQLFCLDDQHLKSKISDFYLEKLHGIFNHDFLAHTEPVAQELFDIETGEGLSDVRYLHQYRKEGTNYVTTKLSKFKESKFDYFYNVIPLLKISEPYLIAAECYASNETMNLPKSIEYLNLLKEKRNIETIHNIPEGALQDVVEKAITKEYRKEFIQEGQLFYYYKRKGLTTFPGLDRTDMTDVEYVLPYPNLEVELGGR